MFLESLVTFIIFITPVFEGAVPVLAIVVTEIETEGKEVGTGTEETEEVDPGMQRGRGRNTVMR